MKNKLITTGMEILITGILIGFSIGLVIGAMAQHYKTYGD